VKFSRKTLNVKPFQKRLLERQSEEYLPEQHGSVLDNKTLPYLPAFFRPFYCGFP
jgi:hypothetical protein